MLKNYLHLAFEKYLALVLVGFVINMVGAAPAFARSNAGKEVQPVEKIKANILKRGTGPKARVSIKRVDGTKVKGYLSQAGADSFTVIDSRSAQSTTIAYSDVTEVKGAGLSKGAKIGIGLGIGAAIAVIAIAVGVSHSLNNFGKF
jgi:hypothetical protein